MTRRNEIIVALIVGIIGAWLSIGIIKLIDYMAVNRPEPIVIYFKEIQ